jgi:hypothetical protein
VSIRAARLALLVALAAWFFSPPSWRYAVPLWLPFLVALAVEVEFAVGGLVRSTGTLPRERSRAPQQVDLDRFGWREEAPEDDDPEFWTSPPVPRVRSTWRRRLVTSVLVLAFAGLVAWGVSVRRGWSSLDHPTQVRVERALSREATRIARHPANVVCDTSGHHVGAVQESDGLAEVGGRHAWLTPGICYRLYRVIDHRDSTSFGPTGRALAVLAHESWHLRGVGDEGIANCYAFQSGVGVGRRLGLSESRARALMRAQLADNASDAAANPQYLVPSGCRDGGRYDLDPRSSRFP